MKFVDEAKIFVKAGDGGKGCVSFRREKFIPRGGPNGGDGGKGGDVILVASKRLHSLLDFKFRQHFRAKNGGHGKGQDKHGKNGTPVFIYLPVGTIIRDTQTGEILTDLIEDGQSHIAARGGAGGLGNAHFATSTCRAPRHAQPGLPGEEHELLLVLKLLADVGLVGAPNAGKSTLLSKLTSARPKIADYPFTTLTPNLGVVSLPDFPLFVLADIPGLIEGAHVGSGLGTQFLRHIERTRLLLHVIDASLGPEGAFEIWTKISAELDSYSKSLSDKPQIIALNKIDLIAAEELDAVRTAFKEAGFDVLSISAEKGVGIEDLKAILAKNLAELEYERIE